MGVLSEIITAEKSTAKRLADSVPTPQPAGATGLTPSQLPPPIPCLFCNCPAIWSSIYEPDLYRCCDCDLPPAASLISQRWLIVLGDYGEPEWEEFKPRDFRREPWQPEISTTRDQPPGGPSAATEPRSYISARWRSDWASERHSGLGRGSFPPIPTTTPSPEILATPNQICPSCNLPRVLSELRFLTGGRCYDCWCGSLIFWSGL